MDSLKYIKDYYQVPANKGQKILYEGEIGEIVGASGPHLKVKFLDHKNPLILHPTWKIQYLDSSDDNLN
jgi:hypothetical protein